MKRKGDFVGVDEKFIPEDEKYVDESLLGDQEKSKRKIKRFYLAFFSIPIIFFVGTLIGMIGMATQSNSNRNKVTVNYYFEQYQGTEDGWTVRDVLDKVVTHNKTNDYSMTVVYKENTATLEEDIVAIKNQITNKEYEVSIDYDKKGRANKITIKDI